MPKRTWSLNRDKAIYKDSCVTCGVLRKFLKPLYGSGVTNSIGLDTTSLLLSLNTNFGKCANWTYWGGKIFNTCKLWDSIAHFYAPSNSDDAHILFSYISSYVIGTSNFTVESWVWRDSIAGASEPTIISKEHQNPMSGEIGGFRLYLNSSGNVKFTIGDAQSIPNPPGHQATITTTSTIPFRQWKHIVAIRNGNNPNNWSIYINGTLATVTVSGPTLPSGNIEQGSSDAISVGAGIISGNNNAWHGRLAKARMYKSAISSTNITNSYNSGCGTASAVISSDLDAPLNSVLLTELDHSNTGSKITGGSGTVTWSVHWRDSLCVAADTTSLFCYTVLLAKNKRSLRYGFNGKERYDEIYGNGDEYDYGARVYDARLGRFMSIDPLTTKFPFQSPYSAFNLSPFIFVDPSGMGGDYFASYVKNTSTGKTDLIISNYVDNGTNANNRLFILDRSANKSTKYRKEYQGSYYQMQMIPTSWYTEDQMKSGSLFSSDSRSTYDKDRSEWLNGSGADYSDKSWLQRWGNDLSDNDFLEQGGQLLIGGLGVYKGAIIGAISIRRFFQQPGSRPGKAFTPAGKKDVWETNAQKNGGTNKCETCGTQVVKPKQHKKGEIPPKNEGHVDHVNKKKDGGSGTPDNGRIRCRDCNIKDNK